MLQVKEGYMVACEPSTIYIPNWALNFVLYQNLNSLVLELWISSWIFVFFCFLLINWELLQILFFKMLAILFVW